MRFRSQRVAYPYFVVAMLLFGLQMVFGLLAAAKYLGPDPLLNVLPFDVVKAIHTNLLLVWLLTGFMGATYYLVPEESRVELYSVRLAYVQLAIWTAMGVTAVVGYVFRWTAGNKLLEQPLPLKIVIVIVMLIFLFNIGMTIRAGGRLTTTEGVLVAGLACTALLYLPALFEFDNYTVAVFYRWWTVHLWVEGVWEMIQGALLAYLLIRMSGVDREVLEKWLYVIVGLTFISGILGTAHHYYWIGVPRYWLPIGGFFSALEPFVFFAMAFVDGETLGQRVRERGPMPPTDATRVLRETAWALAYAHAQGVVHRDVKPDNIMLERGSGRVLVTDFGIATHESEQHLLKGKRYGTPYAMAPEQVRGESHLMDGRTDVWALGVMLYQMLTGRLPFSSPDRDELFEMIRTHDPKPPRQIDRKVPKDGPVPRNSRITTALLVLVLVLFVIIGAREVMQAL